MGSLDALTILLKSKKGVQWVDTGATLCSDVCKSNGSQWILSQTNQQSGPLTKVKSFVQVIDVTHHQDNDLILIRIYHSAILLAVTGVVASISF